MREPGQPGQEQEEDRAVRLVRDTGPGRVRLASLDAARPRVTTLSSSAPHPAPIADPRSVLRLCCPDPIGVSAA